MKIHKEGYSIILVTMALAVFITTVCAWLLPPLAAWIVAGAAALFVLFVTSFFRSPSRIRIEDPETVFAPADGTVVVVEEVTENEYFNDRRLLVSVFMSLSNVHINWFPVIIRDVSWWPGIPNPRRRTNVPRLSWIWAVARCFSARLRD